MRCLLVKMMQFALSLAVVLMLSATAFGAAITVNMVAESATTTMPDGQLIQMWGFRDTADGTHAAGEWKIPTITAVEGDTLTINLANNILVSGPGVVSGVSILIPGQQATEAGAMTPEFFTDGDGDQRVNSFTHSTAYSATTAPTNSYEWAPVGGLRAGTYLIQSGTHAAVQMQMGLYAVLKVDASVGLTNEAYTGEPYDTDVTLLFSEIDPVTHEAVSLGVYGDPNAVVPSTGLPMTSTMEYHPTYFLINGHPYLPGGNALAPASTGQRVLLRFLNAGLQQRFPVLQGTYMTVLAEDGYLKSYALDQYSLMVAPGKTFDAIIPEMPPGPLPLYDRSLDFKTSGADAGGMLAYLNAAEVSLSVSLTETSTGIGTYSYTAVANGGRGTYTYRFLLSSPGTNFVVQQPWSTDNTWTWNSIGLPVGTYQIRVDAQSTGTTGNPPVQSVVSHIISPLQVSLSEVAVGDGTFNYTGVASGGTGVYTYRFLVSAPGTNFVVQQVWSTDNTWNWDPTGLPDGTYQVRVDAQSSGTVGSPPARSLPLAHVVGTAVPLQVTLSEVAVGDGTFDYTAAASGGSGIYTYRFLLRSPGTNFVVQQPWSTDSTWNWDPAGLPAGTYEIRVDAQSRFTRGDPPAQSNVISFIVL